MKESRQSNRRNRPRRGDRALARYRVVQALYAWRQGGAEPWNADSLPDSVDEPLGDRQYAHLLLANLAANMDSLQHHMDTLLDRPAKSLDPVEYSIIMLGLCELIYSDDIPVAVIIDESIQIAQLLAGSAGDKYINAALDSAAKKLR
ncbi:MAG: transcription antitermination factor NusB [Candidatus Porifericomitaceae bacterium WSBS_2022_MAG_OTU9]